MSEELKPCPFCGGEAEIVDAKECGPQAYVVTCNGCMTSSRVIFALMDDVTFDLVSAWNTRAAPKVNLLPRPEEDSTWALDPCLLMEVSRKIYLTEGWDASMEVVELAMLEAERRILEALE